MDKIEIASKLRECIEKGKLLSKQMTGKSTYHAIDRAIQKGKYLVTPYRSLVALDEETQTWFNQLVNDGQIMDFLQVQLRKNLLTNYDVNKACMRGEMIKFDDFGKGCVLYID